MSEAAQGEVRRSRPFDPRVEAIFIEALAAAPERRTHIVRERCGNDQTLIAEVESLLAHHDQSSGVLDKAVVKSLTQDGKFNDSGVDDLPPLREAGGYRLISVLGSGGMGVVYLAEQERPRRTVALKLIRPTLASAAAQRRFEHEAELLARLQHPGIAQIYEAGVANFGHGPQQFIAMEQVRGEPLTACCRSRQFDVNTRLRLMTKVCDAVHHAHQRGVIHRDLKPANILVVTEEATVGATTSPSQRFTLTPSQSGASATSHRHSMSTIHGLQPKILDFGVARVLDSDVAVTTMQTSAGQLVGTLRYMSPEQIAGDPSAIDARSDVYTLGVILYELLAGRLPYLLDQCSIPDAARIIRDQPHTSLSSLNRTYRGDIDTIVNKALEKDPRRRYQSAAELALDLERHLANQPIIARPASAMYSAKKFVRRNKAIVSGVAIAFIALIGGIIGTTNAMFNAREQAEQARLAGDLADRARAAEQKQREVAERQARIAKAVNDFLNKDLLALADPMKQPDANLTLREALDRSAAVVDERFKDEPEIAAAIHTTIGLAYQNLALHETAEKHLQAALHLRRNQSPPSAQELSSAINLLAVLHFHMGKFDESEAGYKESMAILASISGPNAPDLESNLIGLALIQQARGNLAAAEPLIRESLRSKIQALGEDDPDVAHAKDALASLLADMGRHDESEELFREALAVREQKLGADHYLTLLTTNNLAVLLISRNKLDEAKALLERVLAYWDQTLGDSHPAVAVLHHNLADIARRTGDVASAERELRAALDCFRRSLGDNHENTLTTTTVLAELLLQTNRPDEAEPLVREALERRLRVNGQNHPATFTAMMDLGWLHRQRGELEQAISYYRQGLDGRRRVIGEDHPATLRAMGQLAALLSLAKHHDNAEQLYRELLERRRRAAGDDDPATIGTLASLARTLAAQQRFEEAHPMFQEVVDRRWAALVGDHPDLAAALHDLGQNALDLQRLDEAEMNLRSALEIRRQRMAQNPAAYRQTQTVLAAVLEMMGKTDEAQALQTSP